MAAKSHSPAAYSVLASILKTKIGNCCCAVWGDWIEWDALLQPAVALDAAPEKRQASSWGSPQFFLLVSSFALAFSIPGIVNLLFLTELK